QLLTASLGKGGGGLLAIEGEPLGPPAVYGTDRLFVYLRLESAPDAGQDAAVAALEGAGQPVVRIAVAEPYGIGAVFFRWQFATAVAGSVLGVNPFDQPDIEGNKVATRKLTSEFEKNGAMGSEAALRQGDGLVLYTDVKNARELDSGGGDKTVVATLKAHFGRVKAGDYVALLPYLEMSPTVEAEMQGLRALLRDK